MQELTDLLFGNYNKKTASSNPEIKKCRFFSAVSDYCFAPFLASRLDSILETTIVQAASPVMLTVVRPMSKIRSTPATSAIPSTGSPTDVRTIASMIIPAPGTPAVPMEASVAVRTIVSICGSVREIP